MMALFDLPTPLFIATDAGLATFLPAPARLAVWAALAGAGTLLLYKRLSPQARIGEAKRAARQARHDLNAFDGEFADAGALIRNQFVAAFRHLGLVLIPTLISILPLLMLLSWLEGQYAHTLPDPARPPALRVSPPEYQARWSTQWPASGQARGEEAPRLLVHGRAGTVAEVTMNAPVPVVEPRHWWNWLIGNPLGYLPDDAGVARVTIALPEARYLPFGPGWMRHWLALFLPVMLIVSLLTYRWARIE